MLVPLTRQKFEQLVPLIATGLQYKYYWGKFSNFLQRLLISVVSVVVILLVKALFRLEFGSIVFVLGVISAFFWLWYPVFQASMRNIQCRRYKYSGFFRGRVLDWWITDQLIGKQETVNSKGELVIVENREKQINLEIGDDTGFSIEFMAPLRPAHKAIARGQIAEMVLMSNRADLSSIEEFSDIYFPNRNLWVSDYPYLRRDFFNEVGRRLREDQQERPRRRRSEGRTSGGAEGRRSRGAEEQGSGEDYRY
ncbi:phosphate ABC transporter permease [Nostoc sp. MG11]|uniref:phosphate ABC transporter permease n=1 Tax=Nostoc sp. MG11 TaxID=2721166 RepID=UPI001D01C05E|nr:phosphate ABC transporter permease [Nostoc sp. MG11]